MERALILVVVLLFSTAASGEWVEQWYRSDEQQAIQMEQRQKQMIQVEETRCQRKIAKYQGKYTDAKVEDPTELNYLTRYYKWKLGSWTKKCEDE